MLSVKGIFERAQEYMDMNASEVGISTYNELLYGIGLSLLAIAEELRMLRMENLAARTAFSNQRHEIPPTYDVAHGNIEHGS